MKSKVFSMMSFIECLSLVVLCVVVIGACVGGGYILVLLWPFSLPVIIILIASIVYLVSNFDRLLDESEKRRKR